MKLRIVFLICLLLPVLAFSQKKKGSPKLLVYGSDVTAWSAAVQAAKSNVETVLVLDSPFLGKELTDDRLAIQHALALDGGQWMWLLMDMAGSKSRSDSVATITKRDFNPQLAKNALEKSVDAQANLTVIPNQQVIKADKGRRAWEITLSNRQRYSVLSVLDASVDGTIAKSAGIPVDSLSKGSLTAMKDVNLAISRTTVAVGELDQQPQLVFLRDLLQGEKENVLDIGLMRSIAKSPENIGFRSAYGQALGATAAYLAFFKTTSKKIDIRKLQAELLAFNVRMTPYADVATDDRDFKALQKFFLTGVFLGREEQGQYVFDRKGYVKFSDIKDILNDIYTRSQLWFLDNYRDEEMTWKDVIGLIKFVSFKGDEVERQIEKDWSTKFKFEGTYKPEDKITREQFAIITDLFTTSFAKAINLDGTFVK
ncbi:FAD-dependent oxidoreductase [Sphingobacterium lactis]|uniref:FAD dependent oxidoreductase n=1 Tax=Sphingobacterium lactis TaxID=797291 RepID=A0A1H5V6N1_9SPHI|nr:FAD-dependent oxidoreductase [Sphingobacterium lactis]SEF82408.1 FAD dependent oxidoreductase [Sphingobacterium lactis]